MVYKCLHFLSSQFDPEKAHYLVLSALKAFYHPWMIRKYLRNFPKKPISVFGLDFPNPIGLAAGLDKNGNYIDVLLGLGFGFVEIGAVTPKPQLGNPKPRLFRLLKSQAFVNHLGFNNLGIDYCVEQLKKRTVQGIVGINIGKNLTTPLKNSYEDYQHCLEKAYPYVDYATINISSPNTPHLQKLQSEQYLPKLVNRLQEEQCRLEGQHRRRVPILFKISPDLTPTQLRFIASVSLKYRLDGLIATNTTSNFQKSKKNQPAQSGIRGGLSGRPLFSRSLFVVKKLRTLVQNSVPIVGVGGIFSPEDATAFLQSGACLVQIYTGLVYKGPKLIRSIVSFIKS
ncbi:quinone-dependent dihydroorotate dehydrogenase [Coxiella endosymbiont of Amblyomma sculptum]|uniref:quinone-dependent dihydroorotate dehydrogenase n=1 Tax=Coxiella endosymbiont of Amblyomma sculptum TaxID=2487929 RepID=UPI00132ED579|nr:quinone-dependent dihydroorotate dehydrogenase [Coxiella endosymbiont of Amblyomma sculptum]QHG92570.1 quinone-dependent dihydroorotate dehydrogenase [Coxiella endosymbiont of Amblyomma sculptum]